MAERSAEAARARDRLHHLHRFASLKDVSHLREWLSRASDEQLLSLVLGVRELQDSSLEANAKLINIEVKLNLLEQSRKSALLANEISGEWQVRRSRSPRYDEHGEPISAQKAAERAAKLVELTEKLSAVSGELAISQEKRASAEVELEVTRERLAQLESRLAGKEAETAQLTEQVQALILQNKGNSELAAISAKRSWRGMLNRQA